MTDKRHSVFEQQQATQAAKEMSKRQSSQNSKDKKRSRKQSSINEDKSVEFSGWYPDTPPMTPPAPTPSAMSKEELGEILDRICKEVSEEESLEPKKIVEFIRLLKGQDIPITGESLRLYFDMGDVRNITSLGKSAKFAIRFAFRKEKFSPAHNFTERLRNYSSLPSADRIKGDVEGMWKDFVTKDPQYAEKLREECKQICVVLLLKLRG